MTSQVGSGAVAILPTFKGFRSAVNSETDSSAKAASTGFKRVFAKTGTDSGKETGQGFKKAFEGQSTGFSDKAARELQANVARSARAVSAARLQEQDAAGKVRLAERQLAEARDKYASDSSQVVRAEERLATANRQLDSAQDETKRSTNQLQDAQQNLARQADRTADELGAAGRKGGRLFTSGFSEFFKGSFFGSFLGNIASNLTSQIGHAIGAGIRNAIDFGIGTINFASDYKDSINAVQVAYGDAAAAVLDLGKGSAKQFGLSKTDLNAFATQFSSFARTIRGGDPAGFLAELVGRGADFASVYGGDVATALGRFQSGLAGESEPLKQFGVDLSDAAVTAYAYAAGIAAPGEELTEAQKQQARYASLLEQTKSVQGDFINTAGDLANINRVNGATWEELQAKIGEGFLPIATTLAGVLTTTVFPAISQLVDEYGPGIGKMFEDITPAVQSFAEDVLPKLPTLFQAIADALPLIIDGLSDFIPALIDFTGKLALGAQQINDFFEGMNANEDLWFSDLGGKLTLGAQQWDGFFASLGESLALGAQQWGGFFAGIFGWFQDMSNRIATGQSQVFGFFAAIGDKLALGARQWGEFAGAVGKWIGEALRFIGEIPAKVTAAITGAGALLYNSGKSLIQGFIDGIRSMIGAAGDAVAGVLDWVKGFFPHSPALRGPYAGAGWTGVAKSGSALLEQFQSGMRAVNASGPLSASAIAASLPSVSRGGPAQATLPKSLKLVVGDREFPAYVREEAGAVTSDFAETFRGGTL